MALAYKIPIVLEPQSEGGYAVRSPLLPELITEGDTLEEAIAHVEDAITAVLELYEDLGKSLPPQIMQAEGQGAISYEVLVAAT